MSKRKETEERRRCNVLLRLTFSFAAFCFQLCIYTHSHTRTHLVCSCLKQLRTRERERERERERTGEKYEFQLLSRCIYNVEGQKFAHWTQAKIDMLYICTHIDARSITALCNLSRETTEEGKEREREWRTLFFPFRSPIIALLHRWPIEFDFI